MDISLNQINAQFGKQDKKVNGFTGNKVDNNSSIFGQQENNTSSVSSFDATRSCLVNKDPSVRSDGGFINVNCKDIPLDEESKNNGITQQYTGKTLSVDGGSKIVRVTVLENGAVIRELFDNEDEMKKSESSITRDENGQYHCDGFKDTFYVGSKGNDNVAFSNSEGLTVRGGRGDDNISLEDCKNVKVEGNLGDDTITAKNIEGGVIKGGWGNDTIEVSGKNYHAEGNLGNDTIKATGEDYSVNGGLGRDTIEVSGKGYHADGGFGYDTINASGEGKVYGGIFFGRDPVTTHGPGVQVTGGRETNYPNNINANSFSDNMNADQSKKLRTGFSLFS